MKWMSGGTKRQCDRALLRDGSRQGEKPGVVTFEEFYDHLRYVRPAVVAYIEDCAITFSPSHAGATRSEILALFYSWELKWKAPIFSGRAVSKIPNTACWPRPRGGLPWFAKGSLDAAVAPSDRARPTSRDGARPPSRGNTIDRCGPRRPPP